LSVAGKVVLITGATGIVGRRLSKAFVEAGARVALCVRRQADVLRLEQDFPDYGIRLFAEVCDLRQEYEVIRLVHRVTHRFNRLDVAVNAASVSGPKAPVMDYPLEPWRNVLATNITGTYLVCREVLPWMNRQGSGSIINVAQGLSSPIRAEWGANAVSSHGVEALTRLLAAEVRGSGVRVNTIELAMGTADREAAAEADWTQAFLWLASDESANMSGERIRATDFAKTVH